MKKLTLADCANVKISDLYLGFVLFETGPEDAEAIEAQKNSPKEIVKVNVMFDEVRKNIEDKVPTEFLDDFMSLLTEACKAMPPLYGVVMFLLDLDGHYYNLNASEDDPENAIRIDHLEPLSDYYSEEEYRFVEVNGKVCLDVNSPEPYERYEEKITAKYGLI